MRSCRWRDGKEIKTKNRNKCRHNNKKVNEEECKWMSEVKHTDCKILVLLSKTKVNKYSIHLFGLLKNVLRDR